MAEQLKIKNAKLKNSAARRARQNRWFKRPQIEQRFNPEGKAKAK
jgi:hypothetical protein